MRYLTLGISLVALFTTLSCKKKADYLVKGIYVYINDTDSLIDVKSGVYDFKVNPKQSYTIEQVGDGSKDATEKSFVPPMTSAILIFNDSKCDTLDSGLKVGKGEGILGIENYTSEKMGERYYKFIYIFTEVDYNKAVLCE